MGKHHRQYTQGGTHARHLQLSTAVSNSYFQFKQFCIHHDRCAMKVGTDGVLLGAWAKLPESGRLLDIGTGSGLIALMAAQRCHSLVVTGIDIDSEAVAQARENVASSPFASRIAIIQSSLQDFTPASFDAIVCNPPFFEESLLPPDINRSNARHTNSLPFSELVSRSASLLSPNGLLNVILPTTALPQFTSLCEQRSLRTIRLCHVHTTASKPPKRTLATFCKCPAVDAPQLVTDELVLQDGPHRSPAYSKLTADFYLR
ncbi:MAG: methyltransferase [Bacteroidaceae bacterium]|nr:methyltransferase [Bacteroidaceae bacterium]